MKTLATITVTLELIVSIVMCVFGIGFFAYLIADGIAYLLNKKRKVGSFFSFEPRTRSDIQQAV